MNLSRMVAFVGLVLPAWAALADQPPAAVQIVMPGTNAAPAVTNVSGPRIQFATPVYDFGKAKAGDTVKYVYYFTNTGNATLDISHVQPSCGCTASSNWTRRVEVGQTGQIPLEFNTANFAGPVLKTITVLCNDKVQPNVMLQFKGTVWKPIDVAPMFAVLNVPPDSQQASTVVKIINRLEEPITLSEPVSNYRGFKAVLSTNEPGKEFLLTVSSVPPMNAGSVQGQVTLKTSTTNAPTITVTVWANVQAPVMVMPPQVTLPGGPLAQKLTPAITIQNNSTNALKVTDAALNIPGVEFELRELVPGKTFSILLNCPAGFELPQGQQVLFTAKTSHPAHPDIRVPIVQLPRPAAPATMPASLPAQAPQPVVTPAPVAKPLAAVGPPQAVAPAPVKPARTVTVPNTARNASSTSPAPPPLPPGAE